MRTIEKPPHLLITRVFIPVIIEDKSAMAKLLEEAKAGREIEIDLINQSIKDASGMELANFDVEEFRKHCLINGLDDIGLTMQLEDHIERYEGRRTTETPWLDGSGYLKRRTNNGPVKVAAAPLPRTNRGEEKDVNDW